MVSNTALHIKLLCIFSQGMSYLAELKAVHQLLLMVDKMLAYLSPVVIIQRWVRGWLCRRQLASSNNQKIRFGLEYCFTLCISQPSVYVVVMLGTRY